MSNELRVSDVPANHFPESASIRVIDANPSADFDNSGLPIERVNYDEDAGIVYVHVNGLENQSQANSTEPVGYWAIVLDDGAICRYGRNGGPAAPATKSQAVKLLTQQVQAVEGENHDKTFQLVAVYSDGNFTLEDYDEAVRETEEREESKRQLKEAVELVKRLSENLGLDSSEVRDYLS